MLVGADAYRKTVLGFPIFFDVLARALDEVPGEFDALRFRERGNFVAGELGPEQRKQGTESFRNAAVRRGRKQNDVASG